MAAHLRLPGATALAITIIVGSGALVSPGVAFERAGDSAIYAWLIAALVTAPLLVVFARLGADLPGAGGIAGFVGSVFGRPSAVGAEVLLLGTFGLGIPAIALTGGHYLRAIPGLDGVPVWLAALAMLAAAGGMVALGGRVSARGQLVLALVMTASLVAAGLVGLSKGGAAQSVPAPGLDQLGTGAAALGAVYFAFTGWEMLSFTTEEYVDPKRDFPRVVALSFVIVTALYLVLALAVQNTLDRNDESTVLSPISSLVESRFPGVSWAVAVLGVVIIQANLIGAVWAASRLVMSSAREGLLPRPLARISGRDNAAPRPAVAACCAAFILVAVLADAGVFSLGDLLTIAGGNFFLLYLASAVVYAKFTDGYRRLFGIVLAAGLSGLALTFGWQQLLYALALAATGFGLARWRGHRATG